MAIHNAAAVGKGWNIGNEELCTRLARHHIYYQDRAELAEEGTVFILSEITKLTDCSYIEAPFQYKLLPNLNLFVGLDTRDLL